ncbi:Uncharacterised protein [Candidatus Gugararchaeum adminiculabundum]|nr:Uncharacterised protein [Candidatus Gugararchaeum adminiculabundum]
MPGISYKSVALGSMAIGGIGAVSALLGAGSLIGIVASVLAALFALLTIAMYKYGYILMPFFTRGARIVQIHDSGYEVPPGEEAILKKVENSYYASVFLAVNIFESMTDKSPDEQVAYNEFFERAISGVKFVTKFSMMVYVKDLTKYRESLETKRAESQLRLARERDKPDPDVLKLDRFEREAAMWDAQLHRLTRGVKPMAVLCYVMTTGIGVTKESAVATAKSQASELRSVISNALNVEVKQLNGAEMMKCFEWEFMIPTSAAEMDGAAQV